MKKVIFRYDHFIAIFSFIFVIIVLGLLTPNYNHLTYTVSLIAAGPYKNLLGLTFVSLSVYLFYKSWQINQLSSSPSLTSIKYTLRVVSLVFILIAIFPTNQHNPNQLIINEIQLTGWIHYFIISCFYMVTPFGIKYLCQNFSKDYYFKPLTNFTFILGSISFILVAVWIFSYMNGFFNGYLGLLQKIIILINLLWYSVIINKLNLLLSNR